MWFVLFLFILKIYTYLKEKSGLLLTFFLKLQSYALLFFHKHHHMNSMVTVVFAKCKKAFYSIRAAKVLIDVLRNKYQF